LSVLDQHAEALRRMQPVRIVGSVASLKGLTLLAQDLPVPAGSLVSVLSRDGSRSTFGEVVGFGREHAIVMPLGDTGGLCVGDRVVCEETSQTIGVGPAMLGRCVDGLGRPIDHRGPIRRSWSRALRPTPISPMQRKRITQPMYTGIRAIDLMATIGRGQRVGIFSGPGVGKSSLLGQIARSSDADVNVIALIGERGREVRDFIEDSLGEAGMERSVVVVATSDDSAVMRVRAALAACSIAESFRDDGKAVMLMMDSVTRFAHAQRQIGLAAGEPPATKGYTPSVFANLSLLLERAGNILPSEQNPRGGSITGLYTILVEGDDLTEPVSDAARGILDGHLVLSRKLAQRAHFPAIDVLDSVSRVAGDVCDGEHVAARMHIARLMAAYREVEDLVQIGAYATGSSAESDVAIEFQPRINELLRQGRNEREKLAGHGRTVHGAQAPPNAHAGAGRVRAGQSASPGEV
jgi:flagellum-specific ATP synthase